MKLLVFAAAIGLILIMISVFHFLVRKIEHNELDPEYDRIIDDKSAHLLSLLQKFFVSNPGFKKMYFIKLTEYLKLNYSLDYYVDYIVASDDNQSCDIYAINRKAQEIIGGKLHRYGDFKTIIYKSDLNI